MHSDQVEANTKPHAKMKKILIQSDQDQVYTHALAIVAINKDTLHSKSTLRLAKSIVDLVCDKVLRDKFEQEFKQQLDEINANNS